MIAPICIPLRRCSVTLCLALGQVSAFASAQPAAALEFSADIVSRGSAGLAMGPSARLFVASGKVRIDTPTAAAGYFLVDGEKRSALFVCPAQRVFMDAKQSTLLTQIFIRVDPKNPCPQWQAAAKNAGAPSTNDRWRCERNQASTVEEQGAIGYRVVSADQKESQLWIDADLGFPVKLLETDGTTITLEHIRVEQQPANLFALPPDYRKSDPQALIDRIRHSDVWADTPKH
jgi:hypothetical protein